MKRLTFVITWLVVTAAATAVAWTTVGRLTLGASHRATPALSADAVASALRGRTRNQAPKPAPASDGAGGAPSGAAAPPTSEPPTTTPPTTQPAPAAHPADPARPPAAPAPASQPAARPTTATTVSDGHGGSGSSGPGSGSGSPSPTTTTTAASRSAVIESTGGVVTVSCSGSTITLVSSSPRNGYSQEVDHSGPDQVAVKFRSSEHESEIQAVCRNGVVDDQVNEGGDG